jgi:hypothetical protein
MILNAKIYFSKEYNTKKQQYQRSVLWIHMLEWIENIYLEKKFNLLLSLAHQKKNLKMNIQTLMYAARDQINQN